MRVKVRSLKRFLIVAGLVTGLLAVAIPALADYTGPARDVSTSSWERRACDYQAEYDTRPNLPGGYYSCTLTWHETPDSSCPSAGGVADLFNSTGCPGWPFWLSCDDEDCDISFRGSSIDSCDPGRDRECREVERIVSQPPATVSGSISCGTPGSGGWCLGDADLSLSGSEPLSGYTILAIEGTHNGTPFYCDGASCGLPLLEGGNDFDFWAISSWGDTSQMGSASGSLDSTDPSLSGSVSGASGDNGWYVSDVTLSASASDAVSGMASLEASIDGGGWASYGRPITLSDGDHTVGLRAFDVAGNSSEDSESFSVDTVPPQVTLGAGGSFCPGCGEAMTLAFAVTDGGSGVAAWSLTSGGATVASGTSAASQVLGWDGSGLGGGAHTLTLLGRDAAGNESDTSLEVEIIEPTPAPEPPDDTLPALLLRAISSPTPGVSPSAPAPTRTPRATRTPSAVLFGVLPAAPLGGGPASPPLDGSTDDSISNPQSPISNASSLSAFVPSSGVVFGAAALALGAAATAYALDQARRRKEEDARRRAEMARRNAAAERADAEWHATMAAILATAEAARRLKQAKDDARLERKEAMLEPKAPPPPASVDMAKLKQQDYAAGEAWERERAYAVYRDGERQSVPIVPPVVALPWWQKVWEDAKQTQRTVVDWIDQHQAAVSIAVGVVAAATVIVLTAGTATPLVVAGLAALAAGGSVALGTVNLNAHYDRPWSENLLRNTAYGLGGAGVVVGGWAVLSSGALTSAVLGAGNAVAGFCAKTPACARLEPALQLVDTGEQLFLSAQLAVQTATRDPRAGETYIELQLELADGGAPGNTAVREISQETLELLGQHTDEVTEFLARYADDGVDLVNEFGTEIIAVFEDFGDEGVEVVRRYGNEGIELLRIYDGKPEAAEKLLTLAAEGSPSLRNWSEYVPSESVDSVGAAFNVEPIPITLSEDLKVYRYWSDARAQEGHWVTLDSSLSPEEARALLALPAENRASEVTEFVVPKGTTVLLGSVAGQASAPWAGPYALGGGLQLYLPDLTSLTVAPGS